MALKAILNTQSDFTGEFPAEYAKSGLWRFNGPDVDEDDCVSDSSGCDRKEARLHPFMTASLGADFVST